MASLLTPLQICTKQTSKSCFDQYQKKGYSPRLSNYHCQVAMAIGSNPENTHQSERICSMFPGLSSCVAQQSCSYFPSGSLAYKNCVDMTNCIQSQTPEVQL